MKVVLGNESCDLDSAVCALVYAQVLRESLGPSPNGGTMVLPVLNIPQCDLPLKTEVMFYLAENDVPLDLLIFRCACHIQQCYNHLYTHNAKIKISGYTFLIYFVV